MIGSVRLLQLDAAQGRQAVAVRHADVHQHDVDFLLEGTPDRGRSAGRLGNDLDFRPLQQCLHTAPNGLMIVGNEQTGFCFWGHLQFLVRGVRERIFDRLENKSGNNTPIMCSRPVLWQVWGLPKIRFHRAVN